MSEAAKHGHSEAIDHSGLTPAQKIDNLKFAMWLYLASEVVIFGVLIATYVVFRYNNPELVKEAHETVDITLVGFNTFLLLASSWAMVMGLRAIQHNNRQGLLRWIGGTIVLGTVFVALQGVEYTQLAHENVAIYNSEFGMRFYAMTGFHGFHVIIGVLWALWVLRQGYRGRYDKNALGVEIFGLYWHFVDVVWVILFTLIYLI